MKRNRTKSDGDFPGEQSTVSQIHVLHPFLGLVPTSTLSGRFRRASGLMSLLLMLAGLAIPGPAPAFDLGQMFKGAAESIQKQITDKTKDKVDEGEKQVEKSIDQTLGQKPNGPGQAAPTQQGTPAAGGALQAQVHEELLGPYLDPVSGGRVFVSDDGGHVAIAMMKGSRQVMMVDGKEGPIFDEVAGGGISFNSFPPQFDPTGRHCAYLGRRGDRLIAVIDGNEVGSSDRVLLKKQNYQPAAMLFQQHTRQSGAPLILFFFNRDGTRLAYPVSTGGQAKGSNYTIVQLIVDGKPSPEYAAIDTTQIRFAGKRLAYPAQSADGKWHVVVDGKLGPGYEKVKSLQWSADGSHYAYAANTDWKNAQVVVDGVAGKVYQPGGSNGIEALTFTADNRVAYAPVSGILVVDGQEITHEAQPFEFGHVNPFLIPSREIEGSGAPWFALSPDGRRIAYVKHLGSITNRAAAAVIDGKAGLEYEKIRDIQFSPNGKRVAYVARKAGSTYVVVDGEESSGYSKVSGFRFSADGEHYAYEAFQGSGRWVAVVDNKEGPVFQELFKSSLTFSPNGHRNAYVGSKTGSEQQLIVAGEVAAKGYFAAFQEFNADPKIRRSLDFQPLVFSPDGSRLAYIMRQGGTSNQTLVVGNRTYPPGIGYSFPVFSPNSTHFATAEWSNWKLTILVDGREGPTYDKIVQASYKVFRFVDDRTLRFLAIRDGHIYRVTIDAGG